MTAMATVIALPGNGKPSEMAKANNANSKTNENDGSGYSETFTKQSIS